jgi:hypothetical protein
VHAHTAEKEAVANQVPLVPVDESQPSCARCGDLFAKRFDDARDEWVYLNAVRVGAELRCNHCADPTSPKAPAAS